MKSKTGAYGDIPKKVSEYTKKALKELGEEYQEAKHKQIKQQGAAIIKQVDKDIFKFKDILN